MKALIVTILWCAALLACEPSRAEKAPEDLVSFWKSHPRFEEARTEYLAALRKNGITHAAALIAYLGMTNVEAQALFSISLLPTSLQLRTGELTSIAAVSTNRSAPISARRESLRVLVGRFPTDARVENFLSNDLSRYCVNAYDGRDPHVALLSACLLDFLGERAEHATAAPKQFGEYVRMAEMFLRPKFVFAEVNGAMPVPAETRESFHVLVSAFHWKLYEQPALATMCARICLGDLSNVPRLPARVEFADFERTVRFLLYGSKGDPDLIAGRIVKLCAPSNAISSPLLWLVAQANDGAVPAKVLDALAADPAGAPDTVRNIREGKITKTEAFEKPLKRIYE